VRVVIVGGSIVGCAAAAALADVGADVVVLERSTGELRTRGSGLVLPAALVAQLRARELVSASMPAATVRTRHWVVKDGSSRLGRTVWEQPFGVTAVSWSGLFGELRRRVADERYRSGCEVVGVRQSGAGVLVSLADGSSETADLVLAADGYRSQVRRLIQPRVQLSYSGYVIWRGWVDESAGLISDVDAFAERMNTFGFHRGHGNLWVIPSRASGRRGHRQVAWNVYDPLDAAPFRSSLTAHDGAIRALPPGGCTDKHVTYLRQLAREQFPGAVVEAIAATSQPLMTPVYDLRVESMAVGAIALAGDAAMVIRPVTGSGATKGLQDVLTLADRAAVGGSVESVVEDYDATRRPVAEQLLRLGLTMGRALVDDAPDWRSMTPEKMEHWHAAMMAGERWYALEAAG
jgi:2-polyprenyl-6-methoxyphenol hydroxylase-like FAD-dependent oxidoreductase